MSKNDGGKDAGKILLTAGLAGGAAAIVSKLVAAKPVEAAPPTEDKVDYLIECQEAIVALLGQILAATGVAVEVSVKTPWVAKEPEAIFDQAIRSIGTFDTDRMVDCINVKRTLFKVESSLDQAIIIQVVGNTSDSFFLCTNIGAPLPCVANGNISVGLAWDDWHPFIGIRITTAVAPTAGILKVWVVVQE